MLLLLKTNVLHTNAIMFYISQIVFVTKWVLASFIKTFLFLFPENDKHVGNVLLKSQSVIIRNFEKVELEKQCPCSVLRSNPADIL